MTDELLEKQKVLMLKQVSIYCVPGPDYHSSGIIDWLLEFQVLWGRTNAVLLDKGTCIIQVTTTYWLYCWKLESHSQALKSDRVSIYHKPLTE
jgi:hypothetical protein